MQTKPSHNMTNPMVVSVLWCTLIAPGMEYFTLAEAEDGFLLSGQVVGKLNDEPFSARYQIECGRDWRTRNVNLDMSTGARSTSMQIMVDSERRWQLNGQELENVRGCEFVDLGITPSTNTLPIRGLGLSIGGSHEFIAAWIRFPDLAILPLRQRYTRSSKRIYKYESLVNGKTKFMAELEVDEHGLVIDYQGVWKREAAGRNQSMPFSN